MTTISARFMMFAAVIAAAGSAAHAQWTDDPSQNTPIVVKSGSQVQVKLAHLPDGTTYASWLDNTGSGFDVYLQRIDADGNRMWDEDGVLIADRSFSSTQDYGLSADGEGNAWLTFRDDRFDGVQITVARVSPDGELLLGKAGVQVTDTTDFVAAPAIAATGADTAVAGWTHGNEARVAKVDGRGNILWTDVFTFPANSASVSDVQSIGDGTAIVLLINQGGFATPRHLYVQKYDATGGRVWGNDPVVIFNSGSLQFGNFPDAIAAQDGGMAIAWYQNAPSLQCYVQRVDGNGNVMLPAGGLPVSTNTDQLRVEPHASFDEATGDIYVFWREGNLNQSQFGVYGQRVTFAEGAGQRAWGDSGLEVTSLSTDNPTQVRTTMLDGDVVTTFAVTPLGSTAGTIHGGRFDADGKAQWSPALNTISDAQSGKSRPQLITTVNETAILAWGDDRFSSGDIFAQQILADGSLGADEPTTPGDLTGDGTVGVPDLLILINSWGDCADCDDCPADLTGDCTVGVPDLLILINNWG